MRRSEVLRAVTTLEKNIPGLSGTIDERGVDVRMYFRYLCPCGEVSGISFALSPSDPFFADRFVDMVTHQLRAHVEGEGNTPNF